MGGEPVEPNLDSPVSMYDRPVAGVPWTSPVGAAGVAIRALTATPTCSHSAPHGGVEWAFVATGAGVWNRPPRSS